jgi:hypothetical protein
VNTHHPELATGDFPDFEAVQQQIKERLRLFFCYVLERAELLKEFQTYPGSLDYIPSDLLRSKVNVAFDTSLCSTIHDFVVQVFRERNQDHLGIDDEYMDEVMNGFLDSDLPVALVWGLILLEEIEGRDIFKGAISEALYTVMIEYQRNSMMRNFFSREI